MWTDQSESNVDTFEYQDNLNEIKFNVESFTALLQAELDARTEDSSVVYETVFVPVDESYLVTRLHEVLKRVYREFQVPCTVFLKGLIQREIREICSWTQEQFELEIEKTCLSAYNNLRLHTWQVQNVILPTQIKVILFQKPCNHFGVDFMEEWNTRFMGFYDLEFWQSLAKYMLRLRRPDWDQETNVIAMVHNLGTLPPKFMAHMKHRELIHVVDVAISLDFWTQVGDGHLPTFHTQEVIHDLYTLSQVLVQTLVESTWPLKDLEAIPVDQVPSLIKKTVGVNVDEMVLGCTDLFSVFDNPLMRGLCRVTQEISADNHQKMTGQLVPHPQVLALRKGGNPSIFNLECPSIASLQAEVLSLLLEESPQMLVAIRRQLDFRLCPPMLYDASIVSLFRSPSLAPYCQLDLRLDGLLTVSLSQQVVDWLNSRQSKTKPEVAHILQEFPVMAAPEDSHYTHTTEMLRENHRASLRLLHAWPPLV